MCIHILWLFTGCYGEELYLKKLEGWSNRVVRHPVMSRCFLFRNFLMCQDEQVSVCVYVCVSLCMCMCMLSVHTCICVCSYALLESIIFASTLLHVIVIVLFLCGMEGWQES